MRIKPSYKERHLLLQVLSHFHAFPKKIVHLIDGTYELFRHFYGLRRFNKGVDRPYGAVVGVLQTVLQMIENGDAYPRRRRRHVIESFRNRLWADYKTGAGIERAARAIPSARGGAIITCAREQSPGRVSRHDARANSRRETRRR